MLKKLVKFAFSYSAIEGIQRGILFLLIPIFTQYLTTEEYGIVSSSLMVISFLLILFSASIPSAISRYYFKYEDSPQLKDFLGTIFSFLVLFPLSLALFLILFGEKIFHIFTPELQFHPYIIFVVVIASLQPLIFSFFAYLKAKQELKRFLINYNVYFGLQTAIIFSLVVGLHLRHDGYMMSLVIANIIYFIIVLLQLRTRINIALNKPLLFESLRFSFPLIPTSLIAILNRLIDRYYILTFLGLSSVGVYYIGVQIGGIINLIGLAINSAYMPIFFKSYERDKTDLKNIYRLSNIVVMAIGVIASMVYILSPFLLRLFNKDYAGASSTILYLSFSGATISLYYILTNALSTEQYLVKYKLIALIVGITTNSVSSWFLTQKYGISGASIGTLLGTVAMTITTAFIVGKKTCFTFYPLHKLLFLSVLFLFFILDKNIFKGPVILNIFFVFSTGLAYLFMNDKKIKSKILSKVKL